MRTTEQMIDIVHRATGARLDVRDELATKLQGLRRVSEWEQALNDAQTILDVMDVSSPTMRASAACRIRYDEALALVDGVLSEAPTEAHPRRLAEAVRRQVVAARAVRPVSPEVEDVRVDEPSTWLDAGVIER